MKIHIECEGFITHGQRLTIATLIRKASLDSCIFIEDSAVFDGELIVHPEKSSDAPRYINKYGEISYCGPVDEDELFTEGSILGDDDLVEEEQDELPERMIQEVVDYLLADDAGEII